MAIWSEFRQKRGSLFLGRRIEQAVGSAVGYYFKSVAKNPEDVQMHWYMPNEDKPKQLSLEEHLEQMFGGD